MPAFKQSEVIAKIQSGEPVTFSFSYPNENIIKSFNSLFSRILSKVDLIYLLDTLITILREIIVNAVKANAKRVYFAKLNLNINDSVSYDEGIKTFKKNIIGNLESLEKDLKKSDYRVNITIKQVPDGIKLAVINNAPILPEEMERITLRKNKAMAYNDFTDAYEDIYDSTEGAGLGIVLVTLLLKNSGIDVKSYRIVSDGNSTRTSLTVPFTLRPSKITTEIKGQILREVDGIPTFPEHILMLQNLCSDPDANINQISQKIMLDPAITSDLLKLSNSAGFITVKRIENVNEAIMIIGLKNLKLLGLSHRLLQRILTSYQKTYKVYCDNYQKTPKPLG